MAAEGRLDARRRRVPVRERAAHQEPAHHLRCHHVSAGAPRARSAHSWCAASVNPEP